MIAVDIPAKVKDTLKDLGLTDYAYSRTFDLEKVTEEELSTIIKAYESVGERSGLRTLKQFLEVMNDPDTYVKNLRALIPAVRALRNKLPNGWIYTEYAGMMVPFLITGVKYHTARDYESSDSVTIVVAARTLITERNLSFNANDIKHGGTKTIRQLLAERGWEVETPELNAAHQAEMERYDEILKERHRVLDVELTKVRDGQYYYHTTLVGGQCIVEMNPFDTSKIRFDEGFEEGEVPTHPVLRVFDLTRHGYGIIPTSIAKIHEWKDLTHQIILPPLHRRLVEVLTSKTVLLDNEDVVEGKNLGTTILATGKPGLGKTLTAEIFSESSRRALYRVHSGQLGTSAHDVEKALKECFQRSNRWGTILLIDEADTFIRERGDDVEQNAIVAAFLRTMEYFDGLLFLTSNRDDIDDAILSRCSARISFELPGAEERRGLWNLHAKNLGIDISDVIDHLVTDYPKASGRDVLNLLKLVKRYAAASDEPVSRQHFVDCAPFRGL